MHSNYSIKFCKSKIINISCLAILILILLGSTDVHAQDTDTTTADGLLFAAKHAAFNEKDYNKAKGFCMKGLSIAPDYADIRILLGRLYAWTKEYDSAKTCFTTVLNEKPDYEDASLALADVQYWNNENNAALETINAALQYHPTSEDLLIRKAKVLTAMQSYQQADSLLNIILKRDKKNTNALSLSNNIRNNIALNRIGINYDFVTFDKGFTSRSPWHYVDLSYIRQTKKGAVIANVNYANRFDKNGVQFELEAYPRISKTFYCYLDLGYSDAQRVFPTWRAGFSIFANLPKGFEADAGWRYLYFSNVTNTFTAHVGKYYKNYLFGVRTFLSPGESDISQSYNIFTRYYYGTIFDYFEVLLGTGISPDDRSINPLIVTHLKTYRGSVFFKHQVGNLNILSFDASIINQELHSGKKGNQFQVGVGYQRRF